jgi:hypothetical protein
MRNLKFKDVFTLSEIIDKMGLKADINKLFDEAKTQTDAQAYVGGQLMMLMLSRLHKSENEVYKFMAGLTDKKPEDIENMEYAELKELFTELAKSDIFSFFNSATAEKQ